MLLFSFPTLGGSLEMPKDELPNHNCIKHLRSVVQQQQTRIAELEKTSAEHKHQLAEQVGPKEHGEKHVPNMQITAYLQVISTMRAADLCLCT